VKCVFCGDEWPLEKVAFSSVCEGCGRWLHSCIQCAIWDDRARMCRSMTTESVPDREGKNFCEEWQPGEIGTGKKPEDSSRKKFDSLFRS